MTTTDVAATLEGVLYSIACRCIVKVDEMLLGQHPEGEAREAGELALLDLEKPGDQIVAETDCAIPELVSRVGWARAIGAGLAALEESDDADLDLLAGLTKGARWREETLAGGPVDKHLRLALCIRAAALAAMGDPGETSDRLAKRRQVDSDVLALEPDDFRIYSALALLPLCDADRAMLAAEARAA
jgi:hypothetical protein